MIYQLRVAYTTHRWVRFATSISLLAYLVALYWLPGGFPPWAWRLLLQVVPTLPQLWAMRGATVLFPLVLLVCYSLSLLVLWGALLLAFVKLALHWWQGRRRLRNGGSAVPLTTSSHLTSMTSSSARSTTAEQLTHLSVMSSSTPVPPSMGYQQTDPSFPSLPPFPYRSEIATSRSAQGEPDDESDKHVTLPTFSQPSYATPSQEIYPMQAQSRIRLVVGAASDPGLKRKHAPNEDSLLVVQETRVTDEGALPLGLFVVADGMGGHANGEQASQLVVQTMRETILPTLRSTEADEMVCADMLHLGVQRANAVLYERNQQQYAMMGTTLTAALVFGARMYVVSVGDSRTYLYRPSQGLTQITRDHSIVAELVALGAITPDDIYTHPKRNEVTRCLGDQVEVAIDTFIVSLQRGDLILLCSDGLWEMVRDPDMEHIIAPAPRDVEHLAALLIRAALNRGGDDNVSVILVEIASAT